MQMRRMSVTAAGLVLAAVRLQGQTLPSFVGVTGSRPAVSYRPTDPAAGIPADAPLYIELTGIDDQVGQFFELLRQAGVVDPLQLVQQMVRSRFPASAPSLPGAATLLSSSMIEDYRKLGSISLGLLKLEDKSAGRKASVIASIQLGQSRSVKPTLGVLLAAGARFIEPQDGWTLYEMNEGLEIAELQDAVLLASPEGTVAGAVQRLRGERRSLAAGAEFGHDVQTYRGRGGVALYLNMPVLVSQ